MKTLRSILPSNTVSTTGVLDIEIGGIAFDSRYVRKGDLFVALNGQHIDGSAFIFDAIERGAAAVITESSRKNIEVPVVKVKDARQALSEVSGEFYDNPSQKVKLLGITGTKGKTTITYLAQAILKKAFGHAFRIGTVEYDMEVQKIPASNTTPESQVLHSLIDMALRNGIKQGVVEVSSHSLKTWRVEHLHFAVAGFTNLSIEHTEFHPDMNDYFNAKKRLFTDIAALDKPCIISIDDEYGKKMANECKAAGVNVKTLSLLDNSADFYCENLKLSGIGSDFVFCHGGAKQPCHINMPGEYNVFNALMAGAMCMAIGADITAVSNGIGAVKHVPGRLEAIINDQGINVVVDYAHSPAALENVLKAMRPVTKNRLITVFGCGGNRSLEKRPIMGKVAVKYSDMVVVTSDNPRKEQPEAIIEQIMQGINEAGIEGDKKVIQDTDRKSAIFKALEAAKSGDTVVIAGKGHETGQYFADRTIPFDDREVARSFFRKPDEDR
ncbi:MAG: UDP-N-acetylmuramoyl-L-alanyl-D-glutamate--2,6-diaminopimelate ligase [Candidatus Riflebacteria bacterium HGW-Riflebacteria-2]|jgi:UDP-N-acetylmuramoyl-L-alanyl-D-glutamate--2,6-diaminopimelate ligase|nr:MAG: UDP-N-acetylmuramoyl-L-alanyl-D-glutamate--2,6-diaminopimelate ligase [Candidatus Riflebacteria bacterium HGW-Riflebacteria-2]